MSIPAYQSIMLPLLRYSEDQKEHSLREAIETLADSFKLSEEERKELLASGQQAIFGNRVGWARTYLKKAGLLENIKRGFLKITTRGLDVLKQVPKDINVKFLDQFPEFVEFRTTKEKALESAESADTVFDKTPGGPSGVRINF